VLVVDDNHDSAESLEILLQLSGHHVRIAHDGLEAVTAAASFLPDVVVLDIGLPKLNGYEAARRIRALPSGTHLKLVALTGWGQDSDRQRSAASGFDFHLVKPVDHEVLLKLIADVRAR
jgi:CheY-like chemotaxis protein